MSHLPCSIFNILVFNITMITVQYEITDLYKLKTGNTLVNERVSLNSPLCPG